ncbi:hypothetical protein [uncultured Dysgonomonas sp.]|uniref:hypothetical protein n=1 Tax=uncultured Dysgonomonas sp. TaxID=206096 RepID=UPI0025F85ECC|nr:hypothetical protein [uncultured Dysgonomonas sp.]
MASPKSKQKASAKFLGDPQSACRLKGTNGLSPRPFPPRLHRVGTPPAELMRVRWRLSGAKPFELK